MYWSAVGIRSIPVMVRYSLRYFSCIRATHIPNPINNARASIEPSQNRRAARLDASLLDILLTEYETDMYTAVGAYLNF